MTNYRRLFTERYSAALLSDAAYRVGATLNVAPPGLAPLEQRDKIAGPVVTVEANNDLVAIIAATHRAQAGEVVLIANQQNEAGLIGDLLVTEGKRKGIAGFIVDGMLRDAVEITDIGLPVMCRGLWPVGPLKLPPDLKGIGQINVEVRLGSARVQPGDWAFGDADGVIFMAADDLPAVFERAQADYESETALSAEMEAGTALGDIFAIEAFLEKREANPAANFNDHLKNTGRAI